MVEKIIVNPNEIRGYGNIHEPTVASDWSKYGSNLTKTTDTVDGATTDVFQLSPKTYTLTFNSASYSTADGNVTVTVTVMEGAYPVQNATVTVTGGSGGIGTGTTNIMGTVTINVTGITSSGTLTARCGFSNATATVTYQSGSYSLAFSQDTYIIDFLGCTVSCTLTDDGTPVSGETVTFSWVNSGATETVTATTNSSGVATHGFDYFDFGSFPTTVTATYDTASDTCTITFVE